MIKKRIAVFDLDGSLVETDAANSAAYRIALRKLGAGDIGKCHGRITSNVIVSSMKALAGTSIAEIKRLKAEAYRHEMWRTRLGPAAMALRYVLTNRAFFGKVVLLTNSTTRRAIETLRHFGLQSYFDEVVCNGSRGNKYINYFRAFDSDPAACVVWENEEGQVASAVVAGVKVENIRKVG